MSTSSTKKRVAVLGASGYTGAELLRLLAGHPDVEVVLASGDSQAGTPIASLYPSLAARYGDLRFADNDPNACHGLDAVFLGLPHEASLDLVPELVGQVGCVVDLSAAYRLKNAHAYPEYYGFDHTQPALLADAVYGLPERHRSALPGAALIATPGCYVTAATLALAPLVDAGLIETAGVIVDAASGVSGAGRAPKHSNLFCTVNEDMNAYGLVNHRHTPEMEEQIGASVLFTPHLVPMNRGILATCYARPAKKSTTESLLDALTSAYRNEPFVVVRADSPSTKATLGSNAVHITARFDPRTGNVIVISALDNLCKGASGGAVQAMNVALGLPETSGLTSIGVYP
ncbi:MAG: N-acetyl-gamma-glutamyl-phosphate reductase [Actinomycetota bacterium]